MVRVMRDTTVEATAQKLFEVCGASWISLDEFRHRHHWESVVTAWATGAVRSLTDEDCLAVVERLQLIDADWMAYERGVDYDPPEEEEYVG